MNLYKLFLIRRGRWISWKQKTTGLIQKLSKSTLFCQVIDVQPMNGPIGKVFYLNVVK